MARPSAKVEWGEQGIGCEKGRLVTVDRMTHAPRRLLFAALAVGLLAACSSGGTGNGAASTTTTTTSTTTSSAGTTATTTAATAAGTNAATDAPTTTSGELAHMRGTAYTFNTPDPIVGATIKVEELPGVTATTGADGSYDLAVPMGSTVTAYIEAAGHHSIHVQTFMLDQAHDGAELDGVNFQTPTDAVFDALKGLVGGFVGKDPFGGGCVIVSTVSDAKVVGMDFQQFINFHPHGVPGATARISPESAQPIYFNDQVIPDATQLTTSGDGGVLWADVPVGNYTLTASKADTSFDTVRVKCKADWVVNASPVWGLHAKP